MGFSRLDLNLLRVFDAIFQTRSVTEAAVYLHLTQPAVSKQLNRLREILEDPLFVRTNDGMAPTPRAESLAGPIRQSLSEIRKAIEGEMGFDPAKSDRTFRIFMSDLGQMVFLPKLLDLIAREAPGVNIQTVQVPPARMRSVALESGDVDLAVGHFEEFEGSIHRQVLFEEHYVGIVRPDHPTIQSTLSFQRFLQTPHLVYQPSGGGHMSQENVLDRAFWAAGVARRVAVRVAHTMGLTSIVSQTDLLVVVPHRLARACAALVDVKILDLPIDIPRFQIAQYWHDRFHIDPANRWLRRIFLRLYGSLPAADTAVIPAANDSLTRSEADA
ncbi:MAG TPA: LysR family transcriptional regulator [Steroidobacteraceae bacterium]|nr:LysR family transcriptional regulator [Steroidobacteraceae bacterium]